MYSECAHTLMTIKDKIHIGINSVAGKEGFFILNKSISRNPNLMTYGSIFLYLGILALSWQG